MDPRPHEKIVPITGASPPPDRPDPSHRRLGMLVPSSNTVLEPETAKLLPPNVTAHVTRLRVTQIADDDSTRQQFDPARFLAAAELLADAEVDLILWNGTAASWLGFSRDEALCAAITAHTRIPATTAVLAINHELARLGARRLGLVTPYVAPIESAIAANYAAAGYEIVATARADRTENMSFATLPSDWIAQKVREVVATPVDAVMIMCTNVAGASLVEALQRDQSTTVLDSVRVAVTHSLALLSGAISPPAATRA
jgi:maleate isomerase